MSVGGQDQGTGGFRVKRWVITAAVAILVLSLVAFGFLSLIPRSEGHGDERQMYGCRFNLEALGRSFARMRTEGGEMFAETGARFLLQVAPRTRCFALDEFLCPGDDGRDQLRHSIEEESFRRLYYDDWRTAPCSYRGPDEELLARLRQDPDPEGPIIIACDMNGPAGRSPHHPMGVVCLWSDYRVTLVEWDDIKGSGGEPVPVGPDSPDPRFRHLIP